MPTWMQDDGRDGDDLVLQHSRQLLLPQRRQIWRAELVHLRARRIGSPSRSPVAACLPLVNLLSVIEVLALSASLAPWMPRRDELE